MQGRRRSKGDDDVTSPTMGMYLAVVSTERSQVSRKGRQRQPLSIRRGKTNVFKKTSVGASDLQTSEATHSTAAGAGSYL